MDRRTLEEICSRHELEPTLRDVYVEGHFDRDVLAHHPRQNGRDGYVFYEIESVDIPIQTLCKYNLSSGNKQRVLALANELAHISGAEVRCLVDRDLDHWIGQISNTQYLIWTAYTSLDLYFYREDILRSVLIVTAGARIADLASFQSSLEEVLRNLYAMRLADHTLAWQCNWIALKRYLSFHQGKYAFEDQKYIDAVLMNCGKIKERTAFIAEVSIWKNKLTGDPREYIRGHDLFEFLAMAVKGANGYLSFAAEEPLRRLLVGFSDRVDELSCIIP